MSETFYIKKTAFNDIGVGSPPVRDLAQIELDSFIIGPGELNGPAGLNRDSDLELYGFGALKWGEGVDQNQYRQLENFACPQKETGDYWAAGSPPEGAYDSNIHPTSPKDENDLGIGNGITTPLNGQSWYNTTDKTLYAHDETSLLVRPWRSDMTATNDFDMDGNSIIGLGDPDFPATTLPGSVTTENQQDAVTVGWADDRWVNKTGDSMSGDLSITADLNMTGDVNMSGDINLGSSDSLRLGDTNEVQFIWNVDTHLFMNSGDCWITNTDGFVRIEAGTNEAVTLYANGDIIAAFGSTASEAVLYWGGSQKLNTFLTGISVTGNVTVSAAGPSVDSDLTRKDYVVNNFVADAGGNMDPGADLTFNTGGEVLGLPDVPSGNSAAASKKYVDDQITGGVTASSFEYSTQGGNFTLDIPSNVSIIYISGAGGGQGGQGGGDATNLQKGVSASDGAVSYVSTGLETIYFRGGSSVQNRTGGAPTLSVATPMVYTVKDLGYGVDTFPVESAIINLGLLNDGGANGTPGGRGGFSDFGPGGTGVAGQWPAGNPGIRGGGGAGGSGQDGWQGTGGCSGASAMSVPIRVSPGSTISIRTGAGSAGTAAGRGPGGAGGPGYIIITW